MVSLSDIFKNVKYGTLSRQLRNEDKQADAFAQQELNAPADSISVGDRVLNALLGKKANSNDTIGTPKSDNKGNVTIDSSISQTPRVGGVLNDFIKGYKDNRFNPINMYQWGEKKRTAERLGEGLGSLVRFGESPLGRSLIVGGLVGATGGNPLQSLTYGTYTGMLNQANRNADRIYRDDLITSQQTAFRNSPEYATMTPEEQQTQLQNISDNINAQRGYFNKDIYSNLINTQQMRDNADWKKLYFDTQQKNLEATREWQQRQAELQRQEKVADRAFRANENAMDRTVTMRGQDVNANSRQNAADRKEKFLYKQSMSTINVIKSAINAVNTNPEAFGLWQGLGGAGLINRLDSNGVKARSIVNSVTAEYRKYLTGAQMSDAERKEYYKFLPAPTDNSEILLSKLNSMLTVIGTREGLDTSSSVDRLGIL